jgi:hypothetical protein
MKVVSLQTAESCHQHSPSAGQRFGCKSSGFVAVIGFAEQDVPNVVTEQIIGSIQQSLGRRDAAQHQIGMIGILRDKSPSGFQDSVTCLNGDLRGREVGPDQDEDV